MGERGPVLYTVEEVAKLCGSHPVRGRGGVGFSNRRPKRDG